MNNILLVEDEAGIQFANKVHLERHGGYNVALAMNLAEARERMAQSAFNLIVLDIMLPDGSGLDFLAELRQAGNNIPLLLLTALSETSDELKGIQAGGDDYITKPYENSLLLARIQRNLYRASQMPATLSIGAIKLDTASKRAFVDGVDIGLKIKEFSLLEQFVQNPEKIISAASLYEKVWGQKMFDDDGTLRKTISSLRLKLLESNAGYTPTVAKGEGYYFDKQ